MMNASSMDDEGLRNYPRVPNGLLLRRGNTVQMESISAHVFLNLYLDMTSVLYPREAHLNSPTVIMVRKPVFICLYFTSFRIIIYCGIAYVFAFKD